MRRAVRSMVRRLRWLAMLAGFVGATACAGTYKDVKMAAKACGDAAVNAAASAIIPDVAKGIACAETTDGGAENCIRAELAELVKTVAPEVFSCALARIHDQTVQP